MKEEFNFDKSPGQRFLLPYILLTLHKLGSNIFSSRILSISVFVLKL